MYIKQIGSSGRNSHKKFVPKKQLFYNNVVCIIKNTYFRTIPNPNLTPKPN